MVIAIDGPAGVGKSSIAKLLAQKLGFYYLNSGNFYRGITYKLLKVNADLSDSQACVEVAKTCCFDVINSRFVLDGEDVEDKLHNPDIDLNSSRVSVNPLIRSIVNERIHELTDRINVIAEGRDMTTVVFPDTKYKFFFDARPEVRAMRRYKQNPQALDFDKVLQEINERDEIDRNKPVGGLKIAQDAKYVDTSDLTIEQVCEKVLQNII